MIIGWNWWNRNIVKLDWQSLLVMWWPFSSEKVASSYSEYIYVVLHQNNINCSVAKNATDSFVTDELFWTYSFQSRITSQVFECMFFCATKRFLFSICLKSYNFQNVYVLLRWRWMYYCSFGSQFSQFNPSKEKKFIDKKTFNKWIERFKRTDYIYYSNFQKTFFGFSWYYVA